MKQVVTKLGLALAVFATTTVSTAASYAEIPKYKVNHGTFSIT